MKTTKLLAAAVTAALSVSSAYAASIAVNFSENASNQIFNGGVSIGPTGINSSNWNNTASVGAGNLGTGAFGVGNIIDDSGSTVATANVTWNASGTYFTNSGSGTDPQKLVAGYLDDPNNGNAGSNGFTLTGHGYALYDLYVIVAGDAGNGNSGTDSFLHDGFTVNGVNRGA